MELEDFFTDNVLASNTIVKTQFNPPIAIITPTELLDLAPILQVAQDISSATEGTAPTMLSTLSCGLIRTGSLLANARYSADKARTERKRIEGRLALEDWPAYCTEKGIKGTEGLREAFINSHPDAIKARDQEAYYDALIVQLDVAKSALVMGISSVKSVVYGYKDSSSMSGNRF